MIHLLIIFLVPHVYFSETPLGGAFPAGGPGTDVKLVRNLLIEWESVKYSQSFFRASL